jgi:hypothetical protein
MTAYPKKAVLAASALALSAFSVPAAAQVVQGGTTGTAQGTDVSATTCGEGTTTGTSITVSGCAEATATDGTTSTRNRAKVNERMGMQRSTATARDEDERARSMTHTRVRQGEVVSSRTMSIYKERGERPVREVTSTKATPQTTTTKKKPN